jgi:hypothetical protein
MQLRAELFALALPFAVIACSSSDNGEDSGIIYQKPQVLPAINPICLTMMRTEVGKTVNQPIQLQNVGKEALVITGSEIIEDPRNHFTYQGPDIMTVETRDFVSFMLRYAPTEAGWDAGALRVTSNAENYPILDIYIVALSEPAGLDGGSYDPGPRPAIARDACIPADGG